MSNFASYQHNVPTQETTHGPVDIRNAGGGHSGGVTSVSLSGGDMATTHTGVTSVRSGDLTPFAKDDWRSTAMKSNGFRATKIEADSVVKINGMQAHVRDFVGAGILQENPDGSFSMAGETQQETPVAHQTNAQDGNNNDAASMPEEFVQAVDAALEPFSDAALESTMHLAISATAGELDMEAVIRTASKRTGLETKDAAQRVQFVMDAYQAQAVNYLAKQGLSQQDMGDFYDFAVKQKGTFRSALNSQIFQNDLSGYKALVRTYLNSTAPSAAALEANGFAVNGDQVRINGAWMLIKSAAKAGLI